MPSRRTAKAAQAIREVVSSTVLSGLRDPRVKHVTVLRVEVSPDLQAAKVYVSVLGDEKVQALTMHGLNAARGFLQSKVAERIQTCSTPILKFILDQGLKRSAAASKLLKELLGDQAGRASDVERDPEIDALASRTSGGRPGPLGGVREMPDWTERDAAAATTSAEPADELASADKAAEEFIDDDDQHFSA